MCSVESADEGTNVYCFHRSSLIKTRQKRRWHWKESLQSNRKRRGGWQASAHVKCRQRSWLMPIGASHGAAAGGASKVMWRLRQSEHREQKHCHRMVAANCRLCRPMCGRVVNTRR